MYVCIILKALLHTSSTALSYISILTVVVTVILNMKAVILRTPSSEDMYQLLAQPIQCN
jgi:hypothetical protein